MYTYITEEDHECKKTKGISNSVVEDELKYEDYKNILLFNVTYMTHEMNKIQSKNHNIRTSY